MKEHEQVACHSGQHQLGGEFSHDGYGTGTPMSSQHRYNSSLHSDLQ